MTSAESSSPPTLFRFSLLTLLSVMTLAGFTSAIVFSPQWDTDERLLLAFWAAGLILGVSIGRFRGNNGVISGGLGAAIGCLLTTCLMPFNTNTTYLTFVICVSWLTALLAAKLYRAISTGSIERFCNTPRTRWTMLVFISGLLCLFVGTQLLQERRWQPTWEVDLKSRSRSEDGSFQISPQGDFLFCHLERGYLERQTDSLFQFTGRRVVRRELSGSVAQPHMALSPDGKWLAAGTSCYVSLFDLSSGNSASVWKLKDIEAVSQLQFNAKGELLVTSHSPRIQRLYVMDVTRDPLPQPELFPYAGRLMLDPTGEVLVKVYESSDESTGGAVDVVRRCDSKLLGKIPNFPGVVPSKIAAGSQYLAFGYRVWQLGGAKLELAGPVVGFATDDRVIIWNHRDAGARPAWLPVWMLEMPFVRHLQDEQSDGELHLVDLKTGQTVAKTARVVAGLNGVVVSQEGNAVFGATLPGPHLRVWNVPLRK